LVEEYFAMEVCEKHMVVESYDGFTKGIQIMRHGKWQSLLHSSQVNNMVIEKDNFEDSTTCFCFTFLKYYNKQLRLNVEPLM